MGYEKWTNPNTGETFKYRESADGTRDLLIWPTEDSRRNIDHQHHVFTPGGNVRYSRDYNGRLIANDEG